MKILLLIEKIVLMSLLVIGFFHFLIGERFMKRNLWFFVYEEIIRKILVSLTIIAFLIALIILIISL